MTANQTTAKERASALRAWLAANPDATEAEKCETTRSLGFHTQNSLNAEIAAVIAKRSGRAQAMSFQTGDRVRVADGEVVEYGTVRGVASLRPGEAPTLDIEFDSGVWCETPQRFVAHV